MTNVYWIWFSRHSETIWAAKVKCFGWWFQFTFTILKYVLSISLSIWHTKLGCDVLHIVPGSADSAASLTRNWHGWNLLQHRDSISLSLAKQCMHWRHQFAPARTGSGSSSSPPVWACLTAAAAVCFRSTLLYSHTDSHVHCISSRRILKSSCVSAWKLPSAFCHVKPGCQSGFHTCWGKMLDLSASNLYILKPLALPPFSLLAHLKMQNWRFVNKKKKNVSAVSRQASFSCDDIKFMILCHRHWFS